MKLENQVVSLKLAKKLKELGAPQDSQFYWVKDFDSAEGWRVIGRDEICGELDAHYGFDPMDVPTENLYSAFSVAELGEMLPDVVPNTLGTYLHIVVQTTAMSGRNGWKVGYLNQEEVPWVWAETEADARAKMLIWLIENDYLKESK